jgi:quercetin dioxygenase-like cupin family protein
VSDTHETAALYSLGLLSPAETDTFELRMAEEPATAAILQEYAHSAEAIAATVTPHAPPPRLRDRVLGIAAGPVASPGQPESVEGHGAIRAAEGRWRKSKYEKITHKRLYTDKATGLVTMLVRLEPGAVLPAHRHSRTEQCLILEGDLIHAGHTYGRGDFTWAETGSVDPILTTKNGALLLIVGPPDNEEL